MKIYVICSLIALSLVSSGCVVGRRTVALGVPQIAPVNGASKGDAQVVSVSDDRAFENKPKAPSTPSIDGDVTTMSVAQKETMIGRQRNGYGHAMGDIALPDGQTVPLEVRGLIEGELKARGYKIVGGQDASTKLKVSVKEFWAWFTPGMWSASFEARIECAITISKNGKDLPILVSGYGNNQGQVAKNENWREAYERAYTDFLANLGKELEKEGF